MQINYDQITNYLNEITDNYQPEIGIILGSGLSGFGDTIEVKHTIKYEDIPLFPVSTVEGHKGQLLFAEVEGKKAMIMQGRFHYYEGYTMQQLAIPIRTMKLMGVEKLLVTNAAGGMKKDHQIGDIMIITDHINMVGDNPLMGPNDDRFGPRFPDMHQVYDLDMIKDAKSVIQEMGVKLDMGVYLGVSGPCFETPAEYKAYAIVGGDTIGMSTVPEVIVAHHAGIKCFGLSVVTDLGNSDDLEPVSHEEVQAVANEAAIKLTEIIKRIIALQ